MAKVEDQETSQTKAWRYIFRTLKVRGELEGDLAHSLWNCFKNALMKVDLADGSDLQTCKLKLTIACNFAHGAFRSGDKRIKMKECLSDFLKKQDSDWWQTFCEDLAEDRGFQREENSPLELLEDVISSRSIASKGRYVALPAFKTISALLDERFSRPSRTFLML